MEKFDRLQNINQLDNRAWVPHNIPFELRKELYRRKLDIGINFNNNITSWNSNNDWAKYAGPMTSWARVTSNGTGTKKGTNTETKREGFVLYGGDNFYDAFGKLDLTEPSPYYAPYTTNILGYDVYNNPHTLNFENNTRTNISLNDSKTTPILIPPPGIVSIETNIQKERVRKAVINWKCYSFAQLEYMTPYFLTPGISMIVEFGWNHFNLESILNLIDTAELRNLFQDGAPLYDKILKSNGMYDVTFGIVANFEFSSQDGITYDCRTEVYSKHRNHTGALMNQAPKVSSITDNKNTESILTRPSLAEFCTQRLKKITTCLEGKGKNFFDKLSDSDDKYSNTKLIKEFYNGKPEDRIFIGRNRVNTDPFKKVFDEPSEVDWDHGDTDDIWVTMGFFVELINLFVTQEIQFKKTDKTDENYKLYKIDINDTIIGGHKNLISADGDVLLIPNKVAPKFNIGDSFWVNDYKKEIKTVTKTPVYGNFRLNPNTGIASGMYSPQLHTKITEEVSIETGIDTISMMIDTLFKKNVFQSQKHEDYQNTPSLSTILKSKEDKIILSTFKTGYYSTTTNEDGSEVASRSTVFREDLDFYINRFRNRDYSNSEVVSVLGGDFAFPQPIPYNLPGNDTKIHEPYRWGYLKDLFININEIINAAASSEKFEDFILKILNRISGAAGGFWEFALIEDDNMLKIIDKKFISKKVFLNVFQIDIDSDSFVKSVTFSANPSNAQMHQVIAGSSNNQGKNTGTAVGSELLDFYYGDRLGVNQIVPDNEASSINRSSDLIRQLQTYGKVPGAYLVSLKSSEFEYYKILNLALPSVSLLLTILNDGDYENNLNIYGGQQPNFTCEVVLQGISGLRTFQCFSIKNLPKPYSETDVIFQIVDVTHSIQNGDWTTTIKAGIRPMRGIPIQFSNGKDEYDSITI